MISREAVQTILLNLGLSTPRNLNNVICAGKWQSCVLTVRMGNVFVSSVG